MAIDLSSLTAREAITAIYIGYYDRAADPVGLQFWEDVIDMTSLDLVAITSDFAGQDETLALFPFFGDQTASTPSAFITQVYLNLFNREPDAAGLAFWTAQLEAAVAGEEGALSVGQIITSIIEGAQSEADGGFPDEEIIRNKIEVALDWTNSIEAAGIGFDLDGDTGASARSIIDGVDETDASVITARSATDDFVADNEPGVPGEVIILSSEAARDNLTGTEGNDTFEAYNFELQDGDSVDGGSGIDTLTFFNSDDGRTAISARSESVEQVVVTNQSNDRFSTADNNVGGYNNFGDDTVMVDVELDAGQMSGVTRWEDYDSRADLVIEDARDQDDTDGTFTGDITVAMVSTDPGNVDYAVYFDQPVNVSQNFGTLELRVLDQEAAFGLPAPTAGSAGYLTESSLIEFTFAFNGQEIRVELADELGVTYGPNVTFQDLLDQVEAATQQALVDAGVTSDLGFSASLGAPVSVGVGNQFTLPLVLTFNVPADTITASSDDIIVTGRDSGNNGATPATDTFGSLTTARSTVEELIRLNVELDDVGKGSMGGDALFGAMSTGRQTGDDGTSDSLGIQQFDIEVDRSSQLQTINSTNNSLEVVNISNGENDGPNNTTTAADERIGDLVVRGVANPSVVDFDTGAGVILANGPSGIATDGPMPGGVPQHNAFGFSDVRVINAAAMVGAVDLTAELTEEIVEKYLDIQDFADNGNSDDVIFNYDLGTNDDEFLLEMSGDALNGAGTGSREDFRLDIDGNGGADVITTNIGTSDANTMMVDNGGTQLGANAVGALKMIDEQGQDYYELTTSNLEGWYENTVFVGAASFDVAGGAGDDTIWTNGWGNFDISDGTGMDTVYTDNSGVVQLSDTVLKNLDRNLDEHDQIDYVTGAAWVFNAEANGAAVTGAITQAELDDLSGDTNDNVLIATGGTATTFSTGTVTISVSFEGLSATGTNPGDYYSSTGTVSLVDRDYVSDATSASFGNVRIREQKMNQAIKEAINEDAVMSQVLEAIDGPGNSLIIYSKIDGSVIDADTLNITVTNVTVNNGTFTTGVNGSLGGTQYASDAEGYVLLGGDSTAESDNTINVAGDNENDVFVLSTNDAAGAQPTVNGALLAAKDLNGASNEVLEFNANFGVDTVFNFDFGDGNGTVDAAEDVLDFSAITGGTNFLRAFTSAGQDVVIDTVANVDSTDPGASIEASEVVAYFGAGDATASSHILIAWDASGDNGGEVWLIEDGAGATGDVVATEVGTINLIGTDWTSIAADNIA